MRASLVVVASLLLAPGCGRPTGPERQGSPTPAATPAGLTAEDLRPTMKVVDGTGAVPAGIAFEFATRAFDKTGATESVARIRPDVSGAWKVTGADRLEFTASEPFDLSTTYTVTLEKVATKDGIVEAPRKGWSFTFTTPDYRLARAAPRPIDPKSGAVEVDLVFTGPVDGNTARRFFSATVAGSWASVQVRQGDSKETLRATITSKKMTAGAKVTLSLKKGLPHPGGAVTAPAGEETFTAATAAQLTILEAELTQGAAGPHITVMCNDAGAGGQRYGYDYRTGREWYTSVRCRPTDVHAAEKIRFDPPVKFTMAPGRNGFDLFGDFKRGTYKMVIDEGLVTVDGGVLKERFERSFAVPARPSQVSMVGTGRYLPRSAFRNLGVKHVNVDEIDVVVRQVLPANLVFWMADDANEKADERSSKLLVKETVALKGEQDRESTSWIDIASMLPADTRGVLEITVRGKGATNAAVARLLLTDLAVVAKRSAVDPAKPGTEEVFGWALGIDSIEPVKGVELSLVRKNGETVARCTTSGSGGCRLEVPKTDSDGSAPFALLAKSDRDLTYVKWADLKIDHADDDVTGEPYLAERPYRASVYTDRGVYRPGDVAHLVAVLRAKNGLAPPAGLPVTLKVTDPRERLAKSVPLKTNEAGLVSFDLPFEAFADTGKWNVGVEIAGGSVTSHSIQVEEFVPERMKVVAKTATDSFGVDDRVPVEISAKYLFGGSAEGSEVRVLCALEPSVFKPKQNGGFTYGVWRDEGEKQAKATTLGEPSAYLDEKGQATVECPPVSGAGPVDGPSVLVAKASVFEAGSGRSTLGIAAAPIHPESFYVGLSSKTRKVLAGQTLAVEGIVVDWTGAPVAAGKVPSVELELVRLEPEFNYYYYDDYEGSRVQRLLRPVPEWAGSARVDASGKFTVEVTPNGAAALYLVRARAGKARADLQVAGAYDDTYYWNVTAQKVDQTPRPGRPTALPILAPSRGKAGEPITVTIKAPYKGRVLFTAETHRVIASEWRSVPAGESTWSFEVERDAAGNHGFTPNVYVSALLVKDPHLESAKAYMPDRAFGVASVSIEPTDFVQPVTIAAPKEVRSNSTLEVALDLGRLDGPTYATIAAVDEGILQLTNFKSPDPLAAIFAKRALGVETYETVGWTLLVPPAGTTRSHGGDEGAAESAAGRVQPVKPVALWSGVVRVPESGKLTVKLPVPLYRGKLRVMAVTAGPKRIGSASAQVTVSDPIVVQTTLPRFLTQGDEFQIPVFLTNMSGKKLDIDVSLVAENLAVPGVDAIDKEPDAIEFIGKPRGRVTLEPEKSATAVFHARAKKVVGAAKLRVLATGGGFESHDELDVPFLPAGPRDREVKKLEVAGGTVDLTGTIKGWMPTSERTTFWVTANPWGEAFTNLQPLIRYPYG